MKPVYYASAYLCDYHTGVSGVYISPSFSPYPNITFIFCIAEPAAPFIKLSEAESATILCCTHRCQIPRLKSSSRPRISDLETCRGPFCHESTSQRALACTRYGKFSIALAPPQVS